MDNIDITVTDKALAHLRQSAKDNQQEKIKIDLKDSGCSGYAYNIDFCKKANQETEYTLSFEGLEIVIPKDAYEKGLKGMTIDYVQEGVNYLIKFINPRAINACGCGESFQLKED